MSSLGPDPAGLVHLRESHALGVPDGYMAYGTFLLGYPTEMYHRIPVRKPLDVTWHGAAAAGSSAH